jgi:hypothetical protein
MGDKHICRIDKEEGPWPAAHVRSEKTKAWPLSDSNYGRLVYATVDANYFAPFFKKHSGFRIWVKDGADNLNIYVGRYYGRSEIYDAGNYFHFRHALGYNNLHEKVLEDKLKVGFQGHRVSLGNGVLMVKEVTEWIDPSTLGPVGKLAGKAAKGRPKYFIAFVSNDDVSNIVHMQDKIFGVLINHKDYGRSITLGDAWNHYGDQIRAFLHNCGI